MQVRFTEVKNKAKGYIATLSPIEHTLLESDAYTTEIDIYNFTDTDVKMNIIDPILSIVRSITELEIILTFSDVNPDGTYTHYAEMFVCPSGLSLGVSGDVDPDILSRLKHLASDISMYSYEIIEEFTNSVNPISETMKVLSEETEFNVAECTDMDNIIAEVQKKCQADIIKPKETLEDYVCDSILKEELLEIKDFLEKENMYKECGVDTPKGILLKGAPGTGKTYAARCIAGEVDCYFMVCTASSLQGQYIGSGAQNVKDLFKGAKILREKSGKGVIIFIDELDSFGDRATHNGSASGEENRTINQLLAELSGFEDTEGIMVIGATNYPDRIDDALMRAGRFSRQITIRKPESDERLHLVEYYFNKIKKSLDDTDYATISNLTKGLTPADIKEIANESAILSIRYSTENITLEHINEAVNKVITKNIRTPDGKLDTHLVAAHEAGHVIAEYVYNNNIAIKVTNYSYGGAGGFTQPSEYLEGLFTNERLLNEVKVLLAGRAAEEVMCSKTTNGASNDLEKCRHLLKAYYTEYQFEKYDVEKIKQIVVDRIDELYTEVVELFNTAECKNMLNTITDMLDKHRVLYTVDLAPVLVKEGLVL